MIFPERVFGSSVTTSMASGLSALPRCSTTVWEIAARSAGSSISPRRSTQKTTNTLDGRELKDTK